jgi:hypothetical protein
MPNLPLAFAELLVGGIVLEAAIKGAGISDVVKGTAVTSPISGLSGTVGSPAGGGPSGTNPSAANLATGNNPRGTAITSASGYIDPLPAVNAWERTDQGVDASIAPGSKIVAPGKIKIMGIIPNWYNGQPYIWWKLLDGPDAGQYQYTAEQITGLATVGQTLNQGDTIATVAASGTGTETGWATATGNTLAMATSGYKEGYATKAGNAFRVWLNSLGAKAGTGVGLSIGAGADPDDAAATLAAEARATKRAITTPGYVYKG